MGGIEPPTHGLTVHRSTTDLHLHTTTKIGVEPILIRITRTALPHMLHCGYMLGKTFENPSTLFPRKIRNFHQICGILSRNQTDNIRDFRDIFR